MARRTCWVLALGLTAALGCYQGAKKAAPGSATTEHGHRAAGQGKEEAAKPPPGKAEVARKIIYTARVEVIVEDFARAGAELPRLVTERPGAYLAKSDVQGTPGSPRLGVWTVRVPVDQFDSFLAAVGALGEMRHSSTESQDITDNYYDLAAHIKNDEVREQGLQKLYLAKSAGSKLEDLLAVDRELSAVRGKIEAQKGQLQRWDKETALATVTVTLRDRKDYVPPTVPDFGTNIGRTFQASVEGLLAVGRFLVLAAVALAPWLVVLAVLLVPPLLVWRRRRRPQPPSAPPPAAVTP